MNEKSVVVNIFGLSFGVANCLGGALVAVAVFSLVWYSGRNVSLEPNKKQSLLEYLIDFINRIIKDNIADVDVQRYLSLYTFTLSMFISFMSQLGLSFEFLINGHILVKPSTANPLITMTMTVMTLLLSYNFSVQKFDAEGYLVNYVKSVEFLLPINIIEEFINFLMLSLRLYGNVYAGEVLLTLTGGRFAKSAGWSIIIASIPLTLIWQGFSVLIGSIQVCVFITLSMVYISKKIAEE